jgi:hypothetical protein
MIIEKLNVNDFTVYKEEPNDKGVLGITTNKIVEIPNFITAETGRNMIKYFESQADR